MSCPTAPTDANDDSTSHVMRDQPETVAIELYGVATGHHFHGKAGVSG